MNNANAKFPDCVKVADLDTIKQLLESGVDVHANDDYALKWSAGNDKLDMVTLLLEHGANLHAQFDYALRWSAMNGYGHIVTKLLEHGANIDAGDTYIRSALDFSIEYNRQNIVAILLEHNVNVRAKNDNALHLCVHYQRFDTMEKLLEHGANVHCRDKYILKKLQVNFNETIADIILPYCGNSDYEYFPQDYIKARIIPTKSAQACK